MFVASFLTFAFGNSAWGTFLFPLATLLPLYGVIMAAHIAVTKYANVNLPPRVFGFTWEQIHLVLGLLAGFMAIGWFVTNVGPRGVGVWIEVMGGIALVAGAVNLQTRAQHGSDRLTPARAKLSAPDVVILIAGALLLVGSFLAFYTVPGYTVGTIKVGSQSANAWSRGLFGIATVAVVCGVAMAGADRVRRPGQRV